MCVAQPWPIPSSNQLLEALSKYESLVPTRAGRVSKEQYMEARVWFDEVEDDRSVRIKDVSCLYMCRQVLGGRTNIIVALVQMKYH